MMMILLYQKKVAPKLTILFKAAKNWQLACYSPEFRKQLGLPPETRYECKN